MVHNTRGALAGLAYCWTRQGSAGSIPVGPHYGTARPGWARRGEDPRKGPAVAEPTAPPQDAVLIVTLCEDDRVEIWSRQGRSRAEIVGILR